MEPKQTSASRTPGGGGGGDNDEGSQKEIWLGGSEKWNEILSRKPDFVIQVSIRVSPLPDDDQTVLLEWSWIAHSSVMTRIFGSSGAWTEWAAIVQSIQSDTLPVWECTLRDTQGQPCEEDARAMYQVLSVIRAKHTKRKKRTKVNHSLDQLLRMARLADRFEL